MNHRPLLLLTICLAVLGISPRAFCASVDAFTLPQANGVDQSTTYSTSDHPNGIFIIEAFFDACPHCHNNAPNIGALADEFKSNPRVQVLDIGIDSDPSSYAHWIETTKPNHAVLEDPNEDVIGQLGTSGYPTTYVLDCHLNIMMRNLGEMSPSSKRLIERTVNGLASQDCSN